MSSSLITFNKIEEELNWEVAEVTNCIQRMSYDCTLYKVAKATSQLYEVDLQNFTCVSLYRLNSRKT